MKYKELFCALAEEIICAKFHMEEFAESISEGKEEDIHTILDSVLPGLGYMYYRFDDLIDWMNERFDILNKISFNNNESKDFEKFHLQLCGECETPDIEWFMVNDEIWKEFSKGDFYLCISCLEKRMGRKLVSNDFKDIPLNSQFRKENILN